jgi:hypothetical protein
MNREREEAVQRITARYVEEVRAGHRPNISDYLARNPLYTDEIADFVAYYHAFEVNLPQAAQSMPVISGQFQGAIETAWGRVGTTQAHSTRTITSLLGTASTLQLSVSQLAERLAVSLDILMKLERHAIDATTIPRELIKQLAIALQQPAQVIKAFFGTSQGRQVAETQAVYLLDGQAQSFRGAIEESAQLSEEQRRSWRSILDQETL